MDDEALCDLLEQVQRRSACARSRCRLTVDPHKWWVIVVHWHRQVESRFVPMTTLMSTEQGVMAADLSRWLSRCHHDARALRSCDNRTPLDSDTPRAAPDGGSVGDGSGPTDGDRVGSRRAD